MKRRSRRRRGTSRQSRRILGRENEKVAKSTMNSVADSRIVKKSCVSDIETLSKKQRSKDCFEADYLNFQIEKKKKKKRQAKTEKRNVARLSECLMAVNLCEDSVDSGRGEDLIESCENSKKLKKWKKHKKEKREKKIEEIVLD